MTAKEIFLEFWFDEDGKPRVRVYVAGVVAVAVAILAVLKQYGVI